MAHPSSTENVFFYSIGYKLNLQKNNIHVKSELTNLPRHGVSWSRQGAAFMVGQSAQEARSAWLAGFCTSMLPRGAIEMQTVSIISCYYNPVTFQNIFQTFDIILKYILNSIHSIKSETICSIISNKEW